MLTGLGFDLASSFQIRKQRKVDIQRIARTHFVAQLTNGFEVRLSFDIPYRSADFRDHHIVVARLPELLHPVFDLVNDMRHDLHRLAEVGA